MRTVSLIQCRVRGVTLLEAMVTLAISLTLLLLAVPGFSNLLRDNRRDGLVMDIVVALNYARSEAIKRGRHVTVCPSSDARDCNRDARWETGWIVFSDLNSNGSVDAGDHILRVQERMEDVTVRSTKFRITYQNNGFSEGFMDTLKVCDSRGSQSGRSVIVNMQGRVRVKQTTSVCP